MIDTGELQEQPIWQTIGLPSENIYVRDDRGFVSENWKITETFTDELIGEGPKVHYAVLENERIEFGHLRKIGEKVVSFHELQDMNRRYDEHDRPVSTQDQGKNQAFAVRKFNTLVHKNAGVIEKALERGDTQDVDTSTSFNDVLTLICKNQYPGNQKIAALMLIGSQIVGVSKATGASGSERTFLTAFDFVGPSAKILVELEQGAPSDIGRICQPDILTSATTSGNHFTATLTGSTVSIEDHSTNGTLVLRPETDSDLRLKAANEDDFRELKNRLAHSRADNSRRWQNQYGTLLDYPGMYLSEETLSAL